MATAEPGTGSGNLFESSDKLQNKLEIFKNVIESKKLEVRRVIKELRSLIEMKEEKMIQELDVIWIELVTIAEKRKTLVQEATELIEHNGKQIEEFMNKNSPSITSFSTDITRGMINNTEKVFDFDVPDVKITWKVNELKNCISTLGRCDQQIATYKLYDNQFLLKWSKCAKGTGDEQLSNPCGIAINPLNENIYVADQWNNRIQIFSKEGEWIRFVKDDAIKFPENVNFVKHSMYVQCNQSILKIDESTSKCEKSKFYEFSLGGVCSDNIKIYVGKQNRMNIIVLDLELNEENRIFLKTELCKPNSIISDILLAQELFYVLFSKPECSIQSFSMDGVLNKCIVKRDITCAYHFCLDKHQNIIVSDNGDSKVKIFSFEGKLLGKFGQCGSGPGQITSLFGVSVDEFDYFVTVDRKRSHMLQFIKPMPI